MGRRYCWWRAALVVLALGQIGLGQEPELVAPPAAVGGDVDENVDVLARGPVHEAFAEQVSPDPQPGMVAPKAPPDPIDEVPPDWKPEGEDVVWIPGYWFWDDDRGDYVWVSGVWRRVPPDRRWVPGYWQAAGAGYQWVAGFWGPAAVTELEYAEVPPESLEAGPSSPAPSDDYFWIPGNWAVSVGVGEYRWRPGYWHPYRDNWMWVSARYVWTPRGYIFIPGYWDYTLARRGFLFAPVYFHTPVYRHVGFYYRPTCWIGSDALLLHLFVAPHWNHLYFGDYYAPVYRQRHYIPCYDYHRHHHGFASLYGYYEHHYHRRGIDYCQRVHDWHDHYATHADMRPPHTFRLQGNAGGPPHGKHGMPTNLVVHPYHPERSRGVDRIGGQPMERVASLNLDLLRTESSHVRSLALERRQFEEGRKMPHVDGAVRGTNPIAGHDTFRLPQSQGGSHRKRSTISLPDAPSLHRVPLAKGTVLGNSPPDAGTASNSQLRRAIPNLGSGLSSGQASGTLPPDVTRRSNRGSSSGLFMTPPTHRSGQSGNGLGAHGPMGSGSQGPTGSGPGRRARKVELPPLTSQLLNSTGGSSGQVSPSVSHGGARAHRSVFNGTWPNLGPPIVRGQSPGAGGPAHITTTLPSQLPATIRRFIPPPTAKGTGGEGAASSGRPTFTPPPRMSVKGDSAPAAHGRAGNIGNTGFRSGPGSGSGPAAGRVSGGRGKK